MKFVKLESIENIGDYAIINEQLFFVKGTHIHAYPNKKVLQLEDYWGVSFENNIINVFTNRSFNSFYNYEGVLLRELPNTNIYYLFNEKDFIGFNRITKKTEYKGNAILEGKLGHSFLDKNILFYSKENIIQKINFENPTTHLLWKFNLQDLSSSKILNKEDYTYEARKFLVVLENRLYIYLNTREIIVLDTNNCDLIQRMSIIDELHGESSIGWPAHEIPFFESKYILSSERGTIQALAIDLYYEIDIKNEKARANAYSLKSEFEKYQIDPQHTSKDNVIQNELLYFLDKKASRFAILDTRSKKIVYISEPITVENKPDAYPQLKEIQVNESQVYVLASDHTLHIFDKSGQ